MSNTPHDALVKAILGRTEHAANALRSLVPEALRDALDWSALRRENASYVSVDGGSRHSDLLFSVPLLEGTAAADSGAREVLIYVLFEHQSTPDPLMALRLFIYVGRLFEERVLRDGLARAPLVIPIVLAHGERPWVEPLSLDELYDAPSELIDALGPLVPRLTYLLEDVTPLSDEQIRGRVASAVLRMTWSLLRDSRTTMADLEAYVVSLIELWNAASREDRPAFVSLFEYLVRVQEADPATVRRVIALLPDEAQEDIVSAYDKIRAEGQLEAEAKGKAEGKAEGRRITLAKLLQLKFGALSDDVRARVDAADDAALDLWTERVLFATTLEQLFAA